MTQKAVFAGSLDFIGLADIFQTLGSNNSTGRLKVTCPYASAPGVIYFENGNPVNATLGTVTGLDAVYALFGWEGGAFEFFEEKIRTERAIKNSRMQIVLDALRMLDDGLIQKVGPSSTAEPPAAGPEPEGKSDAFPVIRGPAIDYLYVVNEDYFPDGQRIVREGGHGRWIWILLDGLVRVTRETAQGPVVVAKLGEGCFIGGVASLLRTTGVRSASVVAEGDVQLGVLDADALSHEYASLSREMRAVMLSLDTRLRRITDRAVDLILKKPADPGMAGYQKRIIKQGSDSEDLFAISEGTACVAAGGKKGAFPLLVLKKNDVFGSLPFVDTGHEPGFASVLGSDDLKVVKVDAEAVGREYEGICTTFKNLIQNLGSCIAATTGLVGHLRGQSASGPARR